MLFQNCKCSYFTENAKSRSLSQIKNDTCQPWSFIICPVTVYIMTLASWSGAYIDTGMCLDLIQNMMNVKSIRVSEYTC